MAVWLFVAYLLVGSVAYGEEWEGGCPNYREMGSALLGPLIDALPENCDDYFDKLPDLFQGEKPEKGGLQDLGGKLLKVVAKAGLNWVADKTVEAFSSPEGEVGPSTQRKRFFSLGIRLNEAGGGLEVKFNF